LETFSTDWRAVLALGGFAFFWAWESLAPFFQQAHRTRHAGRNFAIAGLNVLAGVLLFAGLTSAAAAYGRQASFGLFNQLALGETGQAAATVLALDVWNYWWHRANHQIPLLWRFHRMHHSDPQMDVTTATRFHLGEVAIATMLRAVLIVALGASLAGIVLFDLLVLLSTQFHHANISLGRWDRILRAAIVTPDMHKIHHSERREETDSNYTSLLSAWDRLFQTFRRSQTIDRIRFGVRGFELEEQQTIAGLLRTPLDRQKSR